ncbi:ubiquitin hydrolase L3 [Paramyrothecium foliicola]|nr:ubiquitin hydrolase L3 [Paramyrothecium foliicola]
MPTEGVYFRPSGQKTFIPLENNPEVFNTIGRDLGISPELGFHDVYSIDEPELLAHIPRPVIALIFITPAEMYYKVRKAEGTRSADEGLTYDGSGDEQPVMWFHQTIGHACGLYALLHSVAGGEGRTFVKEGSLLDTLFKEAAPLKPGPRAKVLYNSEELEKIHMSVARSGDSVAPPASEPNEFHFIAFVRGKDDHLWELEGGSDGPVDRGAFPREADMLSEAALEQGVKRFIKVASGDPNFSIVALAKKPE